MAAIRTQREIRQRAPWWLFGLLLLNFALMTYDARDDATKQRKIRSIGQAITYPIQQGTSSVGNWIGGLFGSRAKQRNEDAFRWPAVMKMLSLQRVLNLRADSGVLLS